jgi:methionine synthase I (cobalamin-dependent)
MTSVAAPFISSHILANLATQQYQQTSLFIWLFVVLLIGLVENRTIVGSCCGSTPDHTRAIRDVVEKFNKR